MGSMEELRRFFTAIGNDPRIGASHISLYCALFQRDAPEKDGCAIDFVKSEVMKDAKISGIATFHKCIKDLNAFGYIKYQPSYYPKKKSRVRILPQ